MPAKVHTVATIAGELQALLPTLTDQAGHTLARTLIRDLGIRPASMCACLSVPLSTEERAKIMRFAKSRYL